MKRLLPKTIILLSVLSGCAFIQGPKMETPLEKSPTLQGAEGKVKVGTTKNQNTKIELEVKHLARPSQVKEGATTYVVWLKPEAGREGKREAEGKPQPLGILRVDKNLKGELTAITPYRYFSLFVTAEPAPEVTTPSGERLMWTEVSRTG